MSFNGAAESNRRIHGADGEASAAIAASLQWGRRE